MSVERPELTLHEAMAQILSRCDGQTAEQVYLASEINRQKLYWQKDGGPVGSDQIGARAKNYSALFEKIPANPRTHEKAKVRLLDTGTSEEG